MFFCKLTTLHRFYKFLFLLTHGRTGCEFFLIFKFLKLFMYMNIKSNIDYKHFISILYINIFKDFN